MAQTTETYFLIVLETGKFKVKVLTNLFPSEGSLSGLQTATFSLCPHMVKRASSGVSSCSYMGTLPMGLEPHPYDPI